MQFSIKKKHADAVLTGISVYNAGRALVSRYEYWRYERGHVIAISSDDEAFIAVGQALLPLLPEGRQRRLLARTQRNYNGPTEVQIAYEATKPETVTIGGYKVRVSVERGDKPAADGSAAGGSGLAAIVKSLRPDRLVLWSSNGDAKGAVIDFIQQAVRNWTNEQVGPKLYIATSWGDWSNFAEARARALDTVVLVRGQREDLVSDLERFLGQEQSYLKLGLPWHRGYLLHGPPGTGKTSLVRAVASHLGLDLYCLPLADLRQDSQLTNLLRQVQPRSALLLEDLDSVSSARDRDADSNGVSTSGLLNALDGVGTPHGLVTFMTTNRKKTLDEALLRKGRCDRQFKLGYLDDDQLKRLVKAMVGYAPKDLPPVPEKIPPAAVVELMKEHLDEPEAFLADLRKFLANG